METSHEFDYEIVNSRIKPIADRLVIKFEELRHIDTDRVLFLVNYKTGCPGKHIIFARTRTMPDRWRDLFCQVGACPYLYYIEFLSKTTACFDERQMTALVYRELRMIGPEGNIERPDTNDWWQLIAGLGRHWYYPDQICPDLLADDVTWEKLINGSQPDLTTKGLYNSGQKEK